MVCSVTNRKEEYMELRVSLWIEDIAVFIRELIRFFQSKHTDNKIRYREKYYHLDDALDRDIYFIDTSKNIDTIIYLSNDYDFSDVSEEYGADVNFELMFDDAHFDKRYLLIAEIVNWIMKISDTDLAITIEGGLLNFKRVQGKIYYGRESDFEPVNYIPVKYLDFDREKAFEFTRDDKWVFYSEETIREIERWRKKQDA